ncbi:hypothetical protein [Dehalobacter restrictus]|uniref:hypothetical protein n=1 Tax=Dehalobacter restrictus TaxID=55583 RepID=UPI00338FC8BD
MTNINFVMNMTKSFLDGEIDCITYSLGLPYELGKRYRKMVREDREYAELIFICMVEKGTNKFDELSDPDFKKLICKQYKYITDVARKVY